MSVEFITVSVIMLLLWAAFLILDALICGILALFFRISFKKAFLWGLLSLAVPPLATAYGSIIERNIYQVRTVEIGFEDLPEAFDGYSIIHISDLHSRSFEKRTRSLERAVNKINGLNPDLIAFTGDIITMNSDELDATSPVLSRLEAEDGIVSVLGNHDYCIYSAEEEAYTDDGPEKVIEKEMQMGWKPLVNESVIIRRGRDSIAVIGVENTSASSHFPSHGDLSKASGGTEGMFRVLLSHDPTHWKTEIIGKDYPLTLSGHTHNMQFTLLGWNPCRMVFKENKGLYTENGQRLYVNTGLGETIFPARIGAPPEITRIILRRI